MFERIVLATDLSPASDKIIRHAANLHSFGCRGHPVPVILEALEIGGHSLVLMGTLGKSVLAEALVGSVAFSVARLAPCPLLLIPWR